MDLYSAIKRIYPELDDDDFILKNDNDGSGTYIFKWNTDLPQPSQEELEEAWESVVIPPDPLDQPSEVELLKKENDELRVKVERLETESKQESQMNALAIMELAEIILG